ncbi:MAG: discoidin domain-containing protein [Lewinellaceae bacterium]|nr:discoidin domain-containing protein [Saprospiraceae bacterium]MCB9341986.1 discoidin domain-containing protein [Lewinellaceae bacterium]
MKISISLTNQQVYLACSCVSMLLFCGWATAQSCIGEQGKIGWMLYENLPGGDIQKLYHSPKFPQSPDYIEDLNNLATPTGNYNDYYGSLIRGFIKAPETGSYVFNLTGDDNCFFYLGQDTSSNTLFLQGYIPGWTNVTEHNKYPEQTSDTLQLVAGAYYFFEMHQREGGGGDHIQLYWKTPSAIADTVWQIVTGEHVYEDLCSTVCPPAGTPCNDNDSLTVNDQWDGNCGCTGTPTTLPFSCIGQRGSLMALYYDTISGSFVSSMYAAAKYPLSPDRAEILHNLSGPLTDNYDAFGTRIRGYLRAPATGKYIFNVTGDNEVRLMLSPNQTTTVADEIAWNDGYTDDYDHYNTPSQTSDSIDLVAGQFYAIEMVHKEQSGGDDFYVFWKTPLARDTNWHVLDGSFLYRYQCELACLPAGTPCNDGDANTFNDVYDANCTCTGTPCADPQCSNALGYTAYEPCDENTGNHSTNPNSSWLSCEPRQSPNPERGMGHWIQYDFGAIYALDDADIWNYNAAGASAQGFNEVVIDYSLDGVHWSELGTFNFAQATGTTSYGGFNMADFAGISARFVLLTALSNFDGSGCVGLSEIAFNAATCPSAGSPCDDGNPLTENDTYNQFCYCIGTPIPDNDCDSVTMIRNEVPVISGFYNAELTITSSGFIKVGSNVTYVAGESITLEPGFEVEFGAEFLAYIAPCDPIPPSLLKKQQKEQQKAEKKAEKEAAKERRQLEKLEREKYAPNKTWLRISPNPASSAAALAYNLPQSSSVRIGVFDPTGQLVTWILSGQVQQAGVYDKTLSVMQLPSGTYTVSLFTERGVVSERLVVVE